MAENGKSGGKVVTMAILVDELEMKIHMAIPNVPIPVLSKATGFMKIEHVTGDKSDIVGSKAIVAH